MIVEPTHDEQRRRFVVSVEGHACVLEYELSAATMTITHTRVPEAVARRGIAARLVAAALETARSRGWKVVPACSYAAWFLEHHPEYADVLASRPQ